MFFKQIFDPILAQYAYLIGCQRTGEAIIIDAQRDIDRYQAIAAEEDLRIVAAAETHIHADFLGGARQFGEAGIKLYVSGEGGPDWQYEWAGAYDTVLLAHETEFDIGNIRFKALHTPGHTPEHVSFLVTDMGGGATEPIGIISGDFVFVGDLGRPDLLESAAGQVGAREPSAHALYASTRSFLTLEDHLQVWPGHGAGSACGKALGAVPQSTVGYERRHNLALTIEDESHFVQSILDGQPEPSLYFARMKKLNRAGPPVIDSLPDVERVALSDLPDDSVVIDTRTSRAEFAKGHLPGAIHAPWGTSFPIVVGAYVDPSDELYLVVDDSDVDEAVRTLVRIGYDRIGGWAPPSELGAGGELTTLSRTTFAELGDAPDAALTTILDVRGAGEHAAARIPDSINIAHTRLGARLDEIDKNRPVIVHCRSGNRAASASSFLQRSGYEVTLLDGGLEDWPSWGGTVQLGAGGQ